LLGLCFPDLDGLAAQAGGAAGEGIEGTQAARNDFGAFAPVDQALGLLDLVCIGHSIGRLWRATETSAGRHFQRFHDQAAAQRGQLVVQAGRGVACGIGRRSITHISPVSRPASICMMVTPVSASPASMAR
jgi:hypothetical protein